MTGTDGVVHVEPLTAERWDDAVVVFGTRGDAATCWCQFFRLGGSEWRASSTDEKRWALREQAARPLAPGLVAYLDGKPAGWVAVAPRPEYPRLARSRALVSVAGIQKMADESVWSVTCFVVRVGFRRRGVAAALLQAAIAFARDHGAVLLEGYPVEVAPGARRASSELYHGTAATFAAAGFREVGRTSAARPVMRLELA
jgi:GNAT superfamily N-acetyltransferase